MAYLPKPRIPLKTVFEEDYEDSHGEVFQDPSMNHFYHYNRTRVPPEVMNNINSYVDPYPLPRGYRRGYFRRRRLSADKEIKEIRKRGSVFCDQVAHPYRQLAKCEKEYDDQVKLIKSLDHSSPALDDHVSALKTIDSVRGAYRKWVRAKNEQLMKALR
jgi:hypothetical protein